MLSKLYAITDPVLMPPKIFLDKAKACLDGGCRLIQFRDKLNGEIKQQLAQDLNELCKNYDAHLIVNDDLELALSIGATGVHLGQNDLGVKTAREQSTRKFTIGATCHSSLEFAQTATSMGANYLAFGRFFSSKTKPSASPANTSILQQAKNQFGLPVIAIGGININNAAQIIDSGADALAVCHDLFSVNQASLVENQVKKYMALFH